MRWIFAALCIVLFAGTADACSCMRAESAQAQADGADVVFVGTVTGTKEIKSKKTFWDWVFFRKAKDVSSWSRYETSFSVETRLKGAPGKTVRITHGISGAMCGVTFREGAEQLMIASKGEDGKFQTSLCAMPQFSREEFEAVLAAD